MGEELTDSGSEHGSRSNSGSRKSRSRSGSAASSRSRSGSGSGSRSRSGSAASRRSGSNASRRSGSNASRRSGSAGSKHSGSPGSKHSGSPGSKHSGSPGSKHSHRSRSGSAVSKRSGSGSPHSKRSSRSPGSKRSSKSPASKRSSRSPASKRSSKSPASKRSSKSPASKRSRSGSHSPASKKSKSRSGTPASKRSRSRSKSGSRHSRSQSRDSNASGGVGDKRKRKILSDSDSNDAPKTIPAKKNKLIDTDSEEDEDARKPPQATEASTLFGDADDISSDEDGGAKSGSDKASDRKGSGSERSRRSESRSVSRGRSRSRSRSRSGDRAERRRSGEREKTPIPETRIDVEIPRITSDLGREIHFVKLPNFLSVDTRPFDPDTYEDEIDEEETLDEEGRQRLKLKVGNTIRWRREINDKGETVQESNARFVRWSDGSMSLHLGSEIFDVYKQPLQSDHNHLFIRQGTGLQGQAVFRTKLTFRPHSTDSYTHKKMTMSLADRSQKTAGIKILTQVGYDPDADRAQNLKKEEESLRQVMRQRKPVKSKRTKRAPGAAGYSGDQDEGSDDEGAISIAAIKNKYKKGGASESKPIYSSDENDASDGSDFDTRRNKKDKTKTAKALKDSDDDESDNASAGKGSGSDEHTEESGKDSGSEHSDDD